VAASVAFCWLDAGVAGAFCALQTEASPKQKQIAAKYFTQNFITLLKCGVDPSNPVKKRH